MSGSGTPNSAPPVPSCPAVIYWPYRRTLSLLVLFTGISRDGIAGFCQANNLQPSMSHRRKCWGSEHCSDAVAESFFSSLKKEHIRKRIYKTRDLARADIFDYFEVFYNRTRRHSHLGHVTPEAFERASL